MRRQNTDHPHADSNCIAGNEFVHNISVHQASMPKFSEISTFSGALPPNPPTIIAMFGIGLAYPMVKTFRFT